MVAIMVGVAVALLPPVQSALFDDGAVLHSLGGTLTTLSEPVVAVHCLIMAASLAHVDMTGGRHGVGGSSGGGGGSLTSGPALAAARILAGGTGKGLAPAYALLQGESEESADTVRCDEAGGGKRLGSGQRGASTSSPPPDEEWKDETEDEVEEDAESGRMPTDKGETKGDAMGEATGEATGEAKDAGAEIRGDGGGSEGAVPLPSWGSITALVLCRLVLPPLIAIYALLPAAVHLGVLSADDRLMQLVVAVESASSSAQLIIVSLNQLGLERLSSQMSYMYVFQYLFSVFSITGWVTASMSRIY